jgi:EAL domain-containing protein (putative c-di-GMP-specific phosphodiesterase class I)
MPRRNDEHALPDASATQLVAILEETLSFFHPRGSVVLQATTLSTPPLELPGATSELLDGDAVSYPNRYRLQLWDDLEVLLAVETAEASAVQALVIAANDLIDAVREVREVGLDLRRERSASEVEVLASRAHLSAKVSSSMKEWMSVAFIRLHGEEGSLRRAVTTAGLGAGAAWMVGDGSIILAFPKATTSSTKEELARVLGAYEQICTSEVFAGLVVAEYGMGVTAVVDAVLGGHGDGWELLEFLGRCTHTLADAYSMLELRRALPGGGVSIAYQPIVDTTDYSVAGIEAFVRWEHPLRRWRGAQEILNLAEAVSLTPALGWFVTSEAVGQLARCEWAVRPRLHLNISASQVNHHGFASMLIEANTETRAGIVVEFQEEDVPLLEAEAVQTLLDGGVNVAVDSFASGAADLRYLEWLQPTVMKVSLCGWESFNSGRERYLRGLVTCALQNGSALYVTCVENKAVAEGLSGLGVTHAQGSYFREPASLSELA